MGDFNRKIEQSTLVEVKLTDLGVKQWSYFLHQKLEQVENYLETKNNYIELELGVLFSAFGGGGLMTTFIEDGDIYLKETKYEKRKRIIDNIE